MRDPVILHFQAGRAGMTRSLIIMGLAGSLSVASAGSSNGQEVALKPGQAEMVSLGHVEASVTYSLLVSLGSEHLEPEPEIEVELRSGDGFRSRKLLHAGDPDLALQFRPARACEAQVRLRRHAGPHPPEARQPLTARVTWRPLELSEDEALAIEAEPNDSWKQANPMRLGRDVHGTADDVDYLANPQEGKTGLDWFRFEVAGLRPILVYFQLDLLDRDISANMRVYRLDDQTGQPVPHLAGKDPMEIVHDRERERYSKHLSRMFPPGMYYLEVNANHPRYILRTTVFPVPPYEDPKQAVEAGMHYAMNVGDAWFAQIPREGNIYARADNLHDTAMRCTACHASSFPTEANLAAHRYGYPIRSKDAFQSVMDRIANSVTPLYGQDGLYWQRFIAIPLQSQGKQGGILADFERKVTGEPSRTLERFGPFLKAAWAGRQELPADEQNGVVPLDSKFGIAWRDWRVLDELARRTGRADYSEAAANVARILGERAADRRVENLQDRIHRLQAWSLIDRAQFANKIRRETGALLALENPIGGWHENDDGPGPSAVYTTGQLVVALLESGLPRDHPAIVRATKFLLSQQQDFGGWFQSSTHENFRTPMRETRYAVMALARVHPRSETPLTSWGNRDDAPARLPRTDRLVHTLDDLENLWDVPAAERPRFAAEIGRLLAHQEPLVRASAAAALGRLGQAESAPLLVHLLGDPSKIVWRAAAWAMRRIGNRGLGLDEIRAALDHPDSKIRRGAARIFAYQFHVMDERVELADRLLRLTADPDLWTRLQSLKSLRQWFYRTNDPRLQKSIIDTYLARMALPEVPVIRRNLCQGLYIMLDENLGGGVSLQKNIAELPEKLRPGILAARSAVERDILLDPVLDALERGNELQRIAVLDAFDGSFFKGRSFARRPYATIDVGNDREFGFLYEPPLEQLERTFAAVLSAPLPPRSRAQALRLCHFFDLPDRTKRSDLLTRLSEARSDADPGVSEAAAGNSRSDLRGDGRARPAAPAAPVARRTAPLPTPELESFRRSVNPYFYRPGDDGHSCASCHATHSVLRIAEEGPKRGITEADVLINYTSALRVLDLLEPEKSLLLRKPLSPYGQGEPDPSGPTGLTHVGGTRWSSPEHPAYRAILDWIQGGDDRHAGEAQVP